MKKFLLVLLFLFAFPLFVSAQTPTPTPDDDVVKISTNLIQIDVTVTDKKGNVVKDLKPEDFEIYENGEKQEITNFSFVSNTKTIIEAVKNPADKIPVPVPQAELKPQQVRRTMALVVDDLSLSFESAHFVRRALKKFVDEQMQEGDLVAIIRTGAGIGALQQFTSDKRQLYAAIEKVKWNPMGRGNIGAFAPLEPTPLEAAAASGDSTVDEEDIKEEKDFLRGVSDFRESIFATGTLGALKFIVTGMGSLPGRKSVVLFSDGFQIFSKNENGSQEASRVLDFLRELVDVANRASVVFYTIDARGLQTTSITPQDKLAQPTGAAIQQAMNDRSNELFDTQQGLVYLAKQTGGMPFINQNDLSVGVRRVLDDQSYYLIGYQPDSDTFDAKTRRFNKFSIKVKRDNVDVRYRSGFFSVADETIAANTNTTVTTKTPLQQISDALTSPFAANDISLRLNTLFGNDAGGSFVRSLLHVNAQDLKFTDDPTDGSKKATFDVLAISFGDNGQIVDQIGKSYTFNVKGATYEKVLKEGFVYYFSFPVKKPGAYQFRVAIRDTVSSKVGSASQFIEVPDLKKSRLTVSGIVLETFTREQWQALSNDAPKTVGSTTVDVTTNPMNDTSLRKFKRGSILRYGFEVYNARPNASKQVNLSSKLRIYRDGVLVLDGKSIPLDLTGQVDMERVKSVGAVSMGTEMPVGDYILQIIVTDENVKKEKQKIATQFVQFELAN
jgi:VWFA-related protein